MRKISKIVLSIIFIVAFAIPCFASNWVFVTKDRDGNSWYIDEASATQHNRGDNADNIQVRYYWVVKIIPGNSLANKSRKKFKQSVASLIGAWDGFEMDFSPTVVYKVFNNKGKRIGTISRDDATEDTLVGKKVIAKADDILTKKGLE